MDLSARNTFGMRVRCRLYVEITAEADLPALDFAALPQPVFVMGGGSNLLFAGDFPGTILHIAIASEAGLVGTPLTSFAPAPPNLRLGPSPCPCPGVDTSARGSAWQTKYQRVMQNRLVKIHQTILCKWLKTN